MKLLKRPLLVIYSHDCLNIHSIEIPQNFKSKKLMLLLNKLFKSDKNTTLRAGEKQQN